MIFVSITSALPLGHEPEMQAACAAGRLGWIRTSISTIHACRVPSDGRESHVEPTSGIEPDPPEYEAGARPVELRGQGARGARDLLR